MTDTRFPARWLTNRDILRMSGDDFRAWALTFMYSTENRTDGIITPEDLSLLPWLSTDTITRLVAANRLVPQTGRWLLNEFASTQSSKRELDALEEKRIKDAERKRFERARKRADETGVQPDVPTDVQRDVRQDAPRKETGQGTGTGGTTPSHFEISAQSSSKVYGPASGKPVRPCGHPGAPSPSGRCGPCEAGVPVPARAGAA